jgi:glycosyltransferase involved in cell wall biosynthesis
MTAEEPTLVVAVVSYRRPAELAALLPELVRQANACTYPTAVLVVDNDPAGSAAAVVQEFSESGVRYAVEPTPGIAAARNRVLAEVANDDLLVFIDDDEWPVPNWLDALLETYSKTRPAGVVGAVVSEFAAPLSAWVEAGRFFDRRRLLTGTETAVGATNNLLLDLHQIRKLELSFDEEFGLSGGSDTMFTRQLTARGGRLVWCDEALVVDRVPANRTSARWVLLRALRSGNSWSRTAMALPMSRARRLRTRVSMTGDASARMLVGLVKCCGGYLTRSPRLQAGGLRSSARGAGMLLGTYGLVYHEYRRKKVPVQQATSR